MTQLPCLGSSYSLLTNFASCAIYLDHEIYVYLNLYHMIFDIYAYYIPTVYQYPTVLKWYWFPLLSEHPKRLTAPPAIVPDHAAPAPAFVWWSKRLPLPLLRDLVALLGPECDCRAPLYGSYSSSAARLDVWRWHAWFSSFIGFQMFSGLTSLTSSA